MPQAAAGTKRIEAVDLGRGLALAAMAVYHFAWDLEFFGYAEAGLTTEGGWRLFARAIASSFLFLVGASLVLAHGHGLRAAPYLRRLAMVGAAAAAISLVTWLAVPGGFIFFGILHQIALASILGLAFLRLPWPATLAAAVFVLAAPYWLRSPFFDHPALWWVGLSSSDPHSNDYVPLFPWFGAVLAGIAAARLSSRLGLFERLGRWRPGRWSPPLLFAGRHSLAVYLLHQPVLIGAIWLFSLVVPPQAAAPEARFLSACNASCSEVRDEAFCTGYCVCVLDRLDAENMLDAAFSGRQDETVEARLGEIAEICEAIQAPRQGGGGEEE